MTQHATPAQSPVPDGAIKDRFPSDPAGLPACRHSEVVELPDRAVFELRIGAVAKRLGDATVRMLAYNGSIPGPTLKVAQGSEVEVNVVNDGDLEATVHWHGLRLDNRYDGTHEIQAPIAVGDSFPSRVAFPDPGLYWYHPHIREDYGQEMGLYGNVLVVPAAPRYWPDAHREVLLTLDDVLLVAGEPDLALGAQIGEVVRLYLTNTANTRVFRVKLPGARMKLVGGDSGRCEHEEFVDDVVLGPSERAVVDVRFDETGLLTLEHHTPDRTYPLAAITVSAEPAEPSLARAYEALRRDPELADERRGLSRYLRAAPDKTLAFVAEMDFDAPDDGPAGHGHEAAGGIEWEDDMVEVNRITTPANMRWKIIDRTAGAENEAIAWQFRVGERVKIRLVNEMDSDHPVHHPFHIHGAGRFLILARDEVVEANLMWSDTVLVRTGETVDILLDVTNPGRWMAHCHIAEHHESGMMFSFDVTA